jgi:tRNA pseudouridine13 synthase
MLPRWPAAGPAPNASAEIRRQPEDFEVREQLGFEPEGSGEHAFLHLEKRGLNTQDLAQRLSELSGVPLRDIGFSGMKDRNALTSQWFSVGLAGRSEPDWSPLEARGDVAVLAVTRHARKLRRGVHRANRFRLTLRAVAGAREDLEARLAAVKAAGAPNYFGPQRFGHHGATLEQALRWQQRGTGRRQSRTRRSLYLSALRGYLFNQLLAARVAEGSWNQVLPGDVCILQGTRSRFCCELPDADIARRAATGDLHPALPLWGRGPVEQGAGRQAWTAALLAPEAAVCDFLERAGLTLDYRATRLLPDDFCWQFCDDDSLRLEFSLGAGSYATAVLAQIIQLSEGDTAGGDGGE